MNMTTSGKSLENFDNALGGFERNMTINPSQNLLPAADKSSATLMNAMIVRSPSHISNNSSGQYVPAKEIIKNLQL